MLLNNKRVLVVDDNPAIHEDFRKILVKPNHTGQLEAEEAALFGNDTTIEINPIQVDSAYQGKEGAELVEKSIKNRLPYAVAFVDIRMPPGWDGIETIKRIWEIDSNIQTVICSAHSDYSWESIKKILGGSDRLLIIKKPFDMLEIQQMTWALIEKWELNKQIKQQVDNLESLVKERTIALEHQATHDPLTGLPNRALLLDRIQQSIFHAKRSKSQIFVFFFDLDAFKQVNDTLGHAVGDQLLKLFSDRLSANVRETDTVGRLGGDEFVVVFGAQPKENQPVDLAIKFLEKLSEPYSIEGHKLTVISSIGISIYPSDGDNAEILLKHADSALYIAKSKHSGYQIYTKEMDDQLSKKAKLEDDLRMALENKQFILNYQTLFDLQKNTISGVEVLLRWKHPKLGLLFPDDFMSIAEETGLILPIGEWVLYTACKQKMEWQKIVPHDFCLAVNISAYQFHQQNFCSLIRNVLQETQILPQQLELELPESLLFANSVTNMKKMSQLKELGVRVVIDNFGTSYTRLRNFKELPFDKVKIDKSYIQGTTKRENDRAIVEGIVKMTQGFNMQVLAQGVETKEQVSYLKERLTGQVQGYYYGHPLDAEKCFRLLQNEK